MINKELWMARIDRREVVTGVIGLGYVGLPLAVEKAKAGFKTIGFDIQTKRVDMLNRSENYIEDVISHDLAGLVSTGMLRATTDYSQISQVDFVTICVPTPLDEHQQPDISYVRDSSRAIAQYLREGSVVVLESTTYPGTTEELVKPLLEATGLVCGEDFYLGFSPERVDPGNSIYNTKNTPKVVSGIGKDALEVIAHMYRAVLDGEVHTVSTTKIAEMEKILENTYRHVNIALVNELALLCDCMDINIWEVIDAAKTKPYGFQAFYPGPGLGGHCIPLDPYYLSWKAREYGFHTSMIEAAAMVNDRMPEYCVERISRMLNSQKKALNGSNVLIFGVAYKQDIDDCRESPALRVIDRLERQGAIVSYFDPFVSHYTYNGKTKNSLDPLTAAAMREYDIAAVTTAHTTVNYELLASSGIPILDTKNALKAISTRMHIELL